MDWGTGVVELHMGMGKPTVKLQHGTICTETRLDRGGYEVDG